MSCTSDVCDCFYHPALTHLYHHSLGYHGSAEGKHPCSCLKGQEINSAAGPRQEKDLIEIQHPYVMV